MKIPFRLVAIVALVTSPLLIAFLNLGGNFAAVQHKAARDYAKDRAAIAETLQHFLDSWNRHDAHANALTYTDDADVTNVLGIHVRGRSTIEAQSMQTYSGVFKTSHLTGQIRSIRFLAAGLATVDVDWEMTGVILPNGTPVPHRLGLMNWVMAKQANGSWVIEVFHNAEITNPPGTAR